jgi:hypothetical protein
MNNIKIQAELSEKEYTQLKRLRELQTPFFDQIEDLEPKFHFILVGDKAILTVGDWKHLLEKEVRTLCPWGLKKIEAGVYKYTTATRSKILYEGYTICECESKTTGKLPERQEASFDIREFRFKPIKEPKSNSIIVEDL